MSRTPHHVLVVFVSINSTAKFILGGRPSCPLINRADHNKRILLTRLREQKTYTLRGMDTEGGSVQLLLFVLFSGFLFFETFKLGSCNDDLQVGCKEIEKKALLKFKEGLTDPSGRLSSWFGDDCCKWRGVSCKNQTGHVIKLKLRNPFPNNYDIDQTTHELGGEINPSLLNLKYLNYLDLSMNNFGGIRIPEFLGSLTKLRYLNLSSASFGGTIPPNLGNLSTLRYLDLEDNLESSVDGLKVNNLQWLSNFKSLKYLNLASVDLSKVASSWLSTMNMFPSLVELHLPLCQLSNLPISLPLVNLTSLLVLDLSNNGFDSTIPYWLFNLTSLAYLNLNSNNIHGGLPDAFSKLTSLENLDLSENGIEGRLSRGLQNLCNLWNLDLSTNKITGEISEVINGLSGCKNNSLEMLDLGSNELTGSLPDSMGHLINLRYVVLRQNLFSGSIPETVGNLSSLEELYLSNNQMSGNIPPRLGQLSSLVVLDISENSWEGVITEAHLLNLSSLKEISLYKESPNISLFFNIDSDWIPPFKLIYIRIRSCQLGPRFPPWLRNQNKLITVVLNNARISDTIPDWFLKFGLQLDELDVAYNQLRGTVPNPLQFSDSSNVDLSSNLFEGPLPLWSSNVSTLYLRDNLFSGPIPPDIGELMPNLTDLDISWNSLNGSIPLSIGNLNGLTTLVISNNLLSGEIPHVWNNVPLLYIVDMSNNSLSGTIPSSIASLRSVRFLILSSNNLSGELPSGLKNCTEMISLDVGDNQLSGRLPAWIGESMTSLLILRVRNNSFAGNIPARNLTGFKTEVTPETVRYEGRLQVMAKGRMLQYFSILYLVNSLDISRNNISGEMPKEVTSLTRLGTLNLSMNHMTGNIPANIGSLEWLETLDLSMNNFSGSIPPTMASMTFLNHLNLSYNNLSGKIPTGNQFLVLEDPSSIYVGNVALCGFPLTIACISSDPPQAPAGESIGETDDALEKILFSICIGSGFFLGFWGVCGTLIVKQRWRDAYFYFLEEVKDRLFVVLSLKLIYLRRKVFGC
ncbi:unnamed protein product [Ilex paraguariensis]|uniref:Leucine-rich repeat-containing N-terminal plant-type domain-containing protein n=1 Tax=Ilex paraguariensis TaxID=185542 RepID=A0ABC8U1Y2_9AQUA